MPNFSHDIVTDPHTANKDGGGTAKKQFDVCMFVHHEMLNDGRTTREAASLAAQGWRVLVVGIVLGNVDLPSWEEMHGFTLVRVQPRLLRKTMSGSWGKLLRLIVAIPGVIRQFRRANARVYHINNFPGLFIMALSGLRQPIIYEVRELFFDRWPRGVKYNLKYLARLGRPLEKILIRRAAAVIVTSVHHGAELVKDYPIAPPILVRSAVDLRTLGPVAAGYPSNGRRLIAHTGYLYHGRHLPELVAALVHLPNDIGIVLMGDGPLRQSLEEQAKRLGVDDRLTFVPLVPLESVAPTLAQADAAVVIIELRAPSFRYALPNKFFEAVAAGLPLVVSPAPAVAELVKQYDLGVTCDPSDPASIAAAIRTVLQPGSRDRYRANARKAREALNWAAEEQKLVALYERILGTTAVGTRTQP